MAKWEYCAVVGLRLRIGNRDMDTSWPSVWHFTKEGLKKTEIKGDEKTELAKAIATLGEEGWEMTGWSLINIESGALMFKRQKS